MRIPSINWTTVAESFAACNPYGPVFMPDGSIYSGDGEMLVAPRGTAEMVDRHARADRRPAVTAPTAPTGASRTAGLRHGAAVAA